MSSPVSPANDNEELITDPRALAIKQQMMARLKRNALLNSVAESCKFIAGPLFAMGATFAIMAWSKIAIGAAATTGAAVAAAPVATVATVLLGAAAVMLLTGVTCGYMASRIWQGNAIDTAEMNAKSTARHLAKELQTNVNMAQDPDAPRRADGKSWQEYAQGRAEPEVGRI